MAAIAAFWKSQTKMTAKRVRKWINILLKNLASCLSTDYNSVKKAFNSNKNNLQVVYLFALQRFAKKGAKIYNPLGIRVRVLAEDIV